MVDWFGYFITILRLFVFLYFGTILGLLYYSFAIQARESGIGGAGEGLFAKKALKQVLWLSKVLHTSILKLVQVIMRQVLQMRGNSGEIHISKFAGRASGLDEWCQKPSLIAPGVVWLQVFFFFFYLLGVVVLFFSSDCRCCYNLEPISANMTGTCCHCTGTTQTFNQ